jgi:hypothetical protein
VNVSTPFCRLLSLICPIRLIAPSPILMLVPLTKSLIVNTIATLKSSDCTIFSKMLTQFCSNCLKISRHLFAPLSRSRILALAISACDLSLAAISRMCCAVVLRLCVQTLSALFVICSTLFSRSLTVLSVAPSLSKQAAGLTVCICSISFIQTERHCSRLVF